MFCPQQFTPVDKTGNHVIRRVTCSREIISWQNGQGSGSQRQLSQCFCSHKMHVIQRNFQNIC